MIMWLNTQSEKTFIAYALRDSNNDTVVTIMEQIHIIHLSYFDINILSAKKEKAIAI